MPYATTDDLPPSVRAHLPLHAREIFLQAFNHAFEAYGGDEGRAFRVACGAVKKQYAKVGETWVPRGSVADE